MGVSGSIPCITQNKHCQLWVLPNSKNLSYKLKKILDQTKLGASFTNEDFQRLMYNTMFPYHGELECEEGPVGVQEQNHNELEVTYGKHSIIWFKCIVPTIQKLTIIIIWASYKSYIHDATKRLKFLNDPDFFTSLSILFTRHKCLWLKSS